MGAGVSTGQRGAIALEKNDTCAKLRTEWRMPVEQRMPSGELAARPVPVWWALGPLVWSGAAGFKRHEIEAKWGGSTAAQNVPGALWST